MWNKSGGMVREVGQGGSFFRFHNMPKIKAIRKKYKYLIFCWFWPYVDRVKRKYRLARRYRAFAGSLISRGIQLNFERISM